MADLNRTMPRIDPSRFSMVPRADIPRSTFITTHSHKTTFHSDFLIPIHIDEVLPADVHQGQLTIFARIATPLFPIMDTLEIETFFFFVPTRLLWDNWKKMMGERTNPTDSISYTVPILNSPAGGFAVCSLYDYLGLPVTPQLGAGTIWVNTLPFRAYYLIWNEWFRDQNLQNSLTVATDDGPDVVADYIIQKRNKKHDYFTSALPWPLKGGVEVPIPLLGRAMIGGVGLTSAAGGYTAGNPPAGTFIHDGTQMTVDAGFGYFYGSLANSLVIEGSGWPSPNIYADLTTATGATLNALRLAIQTQRLLERDARSGTRYTELLRAHFGVTPEDSRLQRPEYIGGGRTQVQTQAIAQTSATDITGSTSALGSLGAAAIATDQHTFTYNATEHGYIIGLANLRAELTYQQGRHRMWTRQTRYDFYWPVFANLGEQIIRNDEIFCQGDPDDTLITGTNAAAFGYQERWAEYRHRPSRITGLFRSGVANNIDEWHLAQEFASLPALNSAFIEEDAPLARIFAAGEEANNMNVLFDSVFRIRTTRALPMFSVPGMMDRF